MSMLADFADATRELLAVLGEQVTVVRGDGEPVFITAFVDEAVQEVGLHMRSYGNKRVIGMLKSDWQPKRGDLFTARGVTKPVEEVAQDDGIVVTVTLHG